MYLWRWYKENPVTCGCFHSTGSTTTKSDGRLYTNKRRRKWTLDYTRVSMQTPIVRFCWCSATPPHVKPPRSTVRQCHFDSQSITRTAGDCIARYYSGWKTKPAYLAIKTSEKYAKVVEIPR